MQIDRNTPDAKAMEALIKGLQSDDPTTPNDAFYQAGLWRGIVIGILYFSMPPLISVLHSPE